MNKLRISEDLALPIEAVTEKLAWLGRTGSGKTYGAMKLAEQMLDAGAQVGAIDPVGVWRSLRVPAAKGGTAYEVVVFGGLSGDLPLEPTEAAGALVADVVTDRRISFVLDVSQFIPSEQQRVVRAFADRFFHRKKSAPSAIHLFMEECQEFIPENPSGEEQKTLGVMQRMWKLGRNFGIGGSLISQRPQEIAKKALNMSGTLFAFQMTGPQERAAVKKWVADHDIAADIEGVLQKLKRGEPHVEMHLETAAGRIYTHSGVVRIAPRLTADLSSTPQVGKGEAHARALTPIDIDKLKTSFAATIERAKADDPRELRKQLADLKARLAAKERVLQQVDEKTKKIEATVDRIKTTDKPILKDAQVQRLTAAAEKLLEHGGRCTALGNEITAALRGAQQALSAREAGRALAPTPVRVPSRTTTEGAGRSAAHRPAPVVPAGGMHLGPGERAVLTAAAQYPAGVARDQLTVLTGYKRSSRDTYIQRLAAGGLVEIVGGLVAATDAGLAALGPDFEPLPVGDALREYWLGRLPEGERKVLEVMINAHPQPVERDAIDEATGYKSSSRDTYLQRLAARRLVRAVGRGAVAASAELFS